MAIVMSPLRVSLCWPIRSGLKNSRESISTPRQLMTKVAFSIKVGVSYFVRSANASKLQELNISMNWKRVTDTSVLAIA